LPPRRTRSILQQRDNKFKGPAASRTPGRCNATASWAIAGGVQLFYLARIMGTSVAQIDATYGHLLPDSEEYLRRLLDDYDTARREAAR
jgi:hypothetical protein